MKSKDCHYLSKSVEHTPPVWKFGSYIPGLVKPMTYNNTCHFLDRYSISFAWGNDGWLNVRIMSVSGISGHGAGDLRVGQHDKDVMIVHCYKIVMSVIMSLQYFRCC